MARDKTDKTLKGKDTNNTFHPGKGKPSGANREEGLGLHPTDPDRIETYLEMTDKYTDGEDVLADNVTMRHPNRNVSKGEGYSKGKENKNGSDKSTNQTYIETSNAVPEQLPGVLTKDRFAELANYKTTCAISLYIPTHRGGVEVNERFDQIGFKSVLNTVEQKLKEKGMDQPMIQNLLKPGFDLIREDGFWHSLNEGLAVFIADGFFKYIKMPIAPEQEIVLESSFYVTPLVTIMANNDYFYLLTISKQGAKLFKADYFGMQPMAVELPKSIEEVKRISGLDSTTFRRSESGRRANPAAQSGQSHGAGGGNPDGKDNIATYFEAVDDMLWDKVLHKENAPLVLAGVEYEIPIYKSVCDYHNVWEQSLTGNREYQETKELYKEAKELMMPFFEQRLMKALENYGNRSATEFTSSIVEDVIPATHYGRVAQLFVCKNCHVWGTFDEMANEIVIHESQQDNSEDLIDNAVVKTLATGGEVFLLDKERMPADSAVAAIMRY